MAEREHNMQFCLLKFKRKFRRMVAEVGTVVASMDRLLIGEEGSACEGDCKMPWKCSSSRSSDFTGDYTGAYSHKNPPRMHL